MAEEHNFARGDILRKVLGRTGLAAKRPLNLRRGGLDQVQGAELLRKLRGFSQNARLLSSKLDDLIQFQDQKKTKKAKIAALGAPIAAGLAGSVPTIAAISSLQPSKPLAKDRPIMAHLKQVARKAGSRTYTVKDAPIFPSEHPINVIRKTTNPGFSWNIKPPPPGEAKTFMQSFRQGIHLKQVQHIHGLTGSTASRGIAMSPNVRPYMKPGILAHEVGHVKQPKWLTGKAYHIGKHLPGVGSLYAATTSDEKRAKTAATASSAATAPMLAAEIDASVRGAHLLKKGGMKGFRRLTTGVGLASYATLAASPWAAYGVKKSLGGYNKRELSSKLDDLIEFEYPEAVMKSVWNKIKKPSRQTFGKIMRRHDPRSSIPTMIFRDQPHMFAARDYVTKYPAEVLQSVWRKLKKPRKLSPMAQSFHGGEYHDDPKWVNKDIKKARRDVEGLSARLDDMIQFADPRPRNPLGEFSPQGEGGPSPNAMATVYKTPQQQSGGPSLIQGGGAALVGGALGAVGGNVGKTAWAASRKAIKQLAAKRKGVSRIVRP